MPGAPDPIYVLARTVLLDALEALDEHRRAIVLVGAQAIYLHTGDADLAVPGFTTDGDLAIDPAGLEPEPNLTAILKRAGFRPGRNLGTWTKETLLDGTPAEVAIDFLVPESVGGPGRRAARLGIHGTRIARKAKGLEAALVDRQLMTITALDPRDTRSYELWVAGPAAPLVAKLHKIYERSDAPARRQIRESAYHALLELWYGSEEAFAQIRRMNEKELLLRAAADQAGTLGEGAQPGPQRRILWEESA